MYLHRSAEIELQKWKASNRRKPLILRGARQCGKSTLVRHFAREYSHFIEMDLDRIEDRVFFNQFHNVKDLLEALLFRHKLSNINISDCLLFIDEIQESPEAIQSLRYFYEDIPELHVISAGSLLEITLNPAPSFPVGRVEYLYLHPLNFAEFLIAAGHGELAENLGKLDENNWLHTILMDLFHTYSLLGGMPEVIQKYLENESPSSLIPVYENIWTAYRDDIKKYSMSSAEQKVIRHIISVAHLYLDQRIKFQNFGHSNYRSREIGEALRVLHDVKILRLIYPTTDIEFPIKPDIRKSPRLQLLDSGLMNYLLGIQADILAATDLSTMYKGALIPHIIFQEQISLQQRCDNPPHFWARDKSQSSAEVDMVLTVKNRIIPIEIKSGPSGKLKSLFQFMEQTDHPFAVRIFGGIYSINELSTPSGKKFKLLNLPYYLGTRLTEYIEKFIGKYADRESVGLQ